MMRYGYGSGMVGSAWGIVGYIMVIVILVDLVLLGAWLWKQINKK